MRIVLRLEMTITIDVQDDLYEQSKPEQMQTVAECKHCAWRGIYATPVSAKRAHAAHLRFCKGSSSAVKQAFEQLMTK